MEEIRAFLDKRAKEGNLRSLRAISSRDKGRVVVKGRSYIDFSSNDYLGLSGHPKIMAAAKAALDRFGTGSSASRLLSGSLAIHHELEEKTARFKSKEAALVFSSGYQANVGILSALYGRGDAVFSDRLNHASIIDGISLSGAKLFRFAHNDTGHLESLLKKERARFKDCLIVTETIFSMDGDKAPLKSLCGIKDKYDCRMMVDEAHATGIYGKNGSGLVEEECLSGRIDFIMGTFSKALGSFGAYLASSKEITDYLINTCRSFIYSTALPPAVIASNIAGLEVIKDEPARRETLLRNAQGFRENLKEMGLEIKGESQIVPVVLGESGRAVNAAGKLQEKGYWVLPIRPPTVPKGQARLRFSLSYDHDAAILERLAEDVRNATV